MKMRCFFFIYFMSLTYTALISLNELVLSLKHYEMVLYMQYFTGILNGSDPVFPVIN